MEPLQLSQIWTISAILAGFQVTAFTWRIQREIDMSARQEITWVTLPDGIVALSFLILVGGVFVAPLSDSVSTSTAAKLMGTSLMIYAAYPFVLAGHYNLYCPWKPCKPRPRITTQEAVVTLISVILVILGTLFLFGLLPW